jgi:hypothetical protein
MSGEQNNENEALNDIAQYLKHWPGLYVREGDRIVEASAEDASVARNYPHWPDKGPITDGKRLTIMTRKTVYQVNEEIHIIHVVEVIEPGHQVYVMGPKPIYGEYLDDRLVTEPPPEGRDPLVPAFYDGLTLPSPAVDYNYDITSYSFSEQGTHQIYWKLDSLRSNLLTVEISRIVVGV